MEKKQLQALIDYHKKAEKAYLAKKDHNKAEQAKQSRERFEKELKKK
jgi:hypothetical protein